MWGSWMWSASLPTVRPANSGTDPGYGDMRMIRD